MKKLSIILTFFILAAMLLAACTTSGPSIPATGSNTTSTPAAAATGTSTTAATTPSAAATSSASSQATSTSAAPAATGTQPAANATIAAQPTATNAAQAITAMPTEAATATSPAASTQSTATAPAVASATPQATGTSAAGTGSSASSTSTPSASANNGPATGTPQAGVSQAQYVRLSSLMQMSVQTNDKNQVGTVNSVVVERPVVAAGSSANSSSVNATTPYVRYVVVDVNPSTSAAGSSSTGNQVFVPWQAFAFNGAAFGASSTSGSTGTSTSNNVLTLNFPQAAFTGAPRFDATQVQSGSVSNWQSQSSQYWTSQGLSIPATGANASQNGSMVVIGKQMNGFNIVDGNNAVLGQVADFLVDTNTGAVAYAVITAQILNGQTFFIPLSHLSWNFPVGQNTLNNLGNLVINITPAILAQAPSFGSLNNLQVNQDWIQQLNQFWNNIQTK